MWNEIHMIFSHESSIDGFLKIKSYVFLLSDSVRYGMQGHNKLSVPGVCMET